MLLAAWIWVLGALRAVRCYKTSIRNLRSQRERDGCDENTYLEYCRNRGLDESVAIVVYRLIHEHQGVNAYPVLPTEPLSSACRYLADPAEELIDEAMTIASRLGLSEDTVTSEDLSACKTREDLVALMSRLRPAR